ncbi:MAG: AraC family transcriptional regulator, partial [Spirochaetia bacterium]|nr:AraC family transcriptional regulator [Spirochaetia bacterium]
SGYSEFSYATEALSIGVIEYLVKPINTKELLDAVEKAIKSIERETNEKTSQDKALLEESSAHLSTLLQKANANQDIDLSPYLSSGKTACYLSLRLFVASPTDNILYIVMNQIKESSFTLGYDIATYKDELRQVGLLVGFSHMIQNHQTVPSSINTLITSISQKLDEKAMHDYVIGISECCKQAAVSYEQSYHAMCHRVIFVGIHLITYEMVHNIQESYVLSKENRTKLILLLSTQSIVALELFLDTIEQEIEEKLPITYHSLQLLFNSIRDTVSTTLDHQPSSLVSSYEPYQFNSSKEIVEYLKSFCLRAIKGAKVTTNTSRTFALVHKLRSIIQEHCEQQFTLELFCNQNNINTSFFSTQFHQISGCTFQEYLINTRIEKAKRLLRETDNRIGTIATMCGFSDQKYFSKTFKRLTGCTPKEFKNTLRAEEVNNEG